MLFGREKKSYNTSALFFAIDSETQLNLGKPSNSAEYKIVTDTTEEHLNPIVVVVLDWCNLISNRFLNAKA